VENNRRRKYGGQREARKEQEGKRRKAKIGEKKTLRNRK
jgi:hypothetical protein